VLSYFLSTVASKMIFLSILKFLLLTCFSKKFGNKEIYKKTISEKEKEIKVKNTASPLPWSRKELQLSERLESKKHR
jgi:hypothetical protein